MNLRNAFAKVNLPRRDLPLFLLFMTFPICYELMGLVMFAQGQWFGLVFFLVGAPIFAMSYGFFNRTRVSRQLTSLELGRTQIYTETCGGVIGFMSWTFPFVRVAVYDGLLVVKSLEEIQLFPQDISDLKLLNRVTATGVQILHARRDLPHPLIIWTLNPAFLKSKIEQGLHLQAMPQFGQEHPLEGLSDHEHKERKKYPWL